MADLPTDRLSKEQLFTYIGLDMLGPFLIKQHRKEMKRYVIMFTCLSSRTVHLEVVCTMVTDSFIQSLRRFIARCGNIRLIRCDNGTNFTGVQSEVQKAFSEMDDEQISHFLQKLDAGCITWRNNPPSGSHLVTLLVEVESIIISRPMIVESISYVGSESPLCPENLLTMKTIAVLPPPGIFSRPDLYSCKRLQRVQQIANEFWNRLLKEFLVTLQNRGKWNNIRRDPSWRYCLTEP